MKLQAGKPRTRILVLLIGAVLPLLASTSSAQMPAPGHLAAYGRRAIAPSSPRHAARHAARYGGRHELRRVWIPGRHELEQRRFWVRGETRRIWVEPVFTWRVDWRGCAFRVLVTPGAWRTIESPGHWEFRSVRVWRPGTWRTVRT